MMTLLVADDHPIIQVSLKCQIAKFLSEARVLISDTFPDALSKLDCYKVDLIILDIAIPGSENVRMMELIRQKQTNVLILIYSGLDPQIYAIPFLQAGADGFLSKSSPYDEFEVAITSLIKYRKYFSTEVQQLWMNKLGENAQKVVVNPLSALSKQEEIIVKLMLEGKWIKEIANILNLKSNTISTYKKRIFEKLHVSNVTELVQKISVFKHL